MTESERMEFDEMRARLDDALSRVASLESAARESAPGTGGGDGSSGWSSEDQFIDLDADYPVKPFTIHQNDEPDYDNYKMYVPDGCVLYGGVAVPVQGKDGEGWLDLGDGAEGNTYYGHVIPDANGNPDHVEVNTSATASGALASFKIAYVGTSDGGDVQLANGIVSIVDGDYWEVSIEGNTATAHTKPGDYPAGTTLVTNEVTLPTTAGITTLTLHVKYPVKVGSDANYSTVAVVNGGTSHEDNAGDFYRLAIADVVTTVETVEEQQVVRHSLTNIRKHVRYNETLPAFGLLGVYWAVATGYATGFTPHIRATNNAPICGGALADTALPTTCTAWYLIDCTGASPVPSVVTSKNPAAGKVYVQAYNFIDGDMADDLRANLANAVFYP